MRELDGWGLNMMRQKRKMIQGSYHRATSWNAHVSHILVSHFFPLKADFIEP